MKHKPLLTLSTLLALNLVACQPMSTLPSGVARGGSPAGSALRQGATVSVRILPQTALLAKGLKTKAVATVLADVNHYIVTMYDNGGTMVSALGLTNPVTVTAPATTATFSGLPDGTGYYVKAIAYSSADESVKISQTAANQSSNTVDIVNGAPAYSAGTDLAVAMTLLDATTTTDGSTGAVFTDSAALGGTAAYGFSLVNNATGQISNKITTADPTHTFAGLTNVQKGKISGSVSSHEVWVFAADGASGAGLTATPARPTGAGTSAVDGTIAAAFPAITIPANAAATPAATNIVATPVATATGMYADNSDNLYYFNGSNFFKAPSPGYVPAIAGTGPGAVTSMCVNGAGDIFYTTGTDIMKTSSPYTTATSVVTASNVGQIAVDEWNNLYYADTTTAAAHVLKRADKGASAYGTPMTVGATGGAVTAIAVDAFKNVHYTMATTTTVNRASCGLDGKTYGAGSAKANTTGQPTSLCVDRVGNVYFTDTSAGVSMWHPLDLATTVFRVAGWTAASAGTDALAGAATVAGQALLGPAHVAVNASGHLFFTSKGTDTNSDVIRTIL